MKKLLLLFSLTFGFSFAAAAQEEAADSIQAPVEEVADSIQADDDADADADADDDDDADAAQDVFGMLSERVEEETVTEDIIYDLSGRRVDASYRGFVIKNGKKYLQQ